MQKDRICPFPGLRPFNEDESIFFKGREAHIDKIISQLQEKNFLMVTGASGDGKSSIIYAGLIPRSRAGFFKARYNNWLVVDFKPERAPLTNLSLALNKHLNYSDVNSLEDDLSYGFSSLVKTYKESEFYLDTDAANYKSANPVAQQELKNKGANLMILVDQFEELFTNTENFSNGKPSLQAITLINLIIETTKIAEKENLPIYIVCTMRSDYIGDCAAFKGLPELIVYSQFFVPRLKRQEIHRAIVEPAKLSGNKINNRLVERLINELGDGLDQLPILQHALNRIWRIHLEDNSQEMDIIHYAKVGGLDGGLLPESQKAEFTEWYLKQPFFKQKYLEGASLTNVLNAHARELFETSVEYCRAHIKKDISKQDAHDMLRKIFTCLTKINDNRAVRNRVSVIEIKQIIGVDIDIHLIEGLVNQYRLPENTLLKPFITDKEDALSLKESDVLDITHESLIRNWKELVEWTKSDYENTLILNDFKKQLERWEQNKRSSDYLLPAGSLSYFKTWYQAFNPNIYVVAKYDSSNNDIHQKLDVAKKFISSANEYIASSEFAIKKKRRVLIAITTTVILVLLGFTYFAYKERNKALEQREIANQKTEEAKVSEQLAIQSEQEAVNAKNTALSLKEKAEASERIAVVAKQQSEKSKQEAISAKKIAETEKNNAQEQRDVAKKEKANAEQQKGKAEQEKVKAETAEQKSRKLKLLSVAQNLALKSSLYKKNSELAGQLAVQAFTFNQNNGGSPFDPVIYEGLRNAYAAFDQNKNDRLLGTALESRTLVEVQNQVFSADIQGNIYKRDLNAIKTELLAQVKYPSPINFVLFSKTGNMLVTAHDNQSICVWNITDVLNTANNKSISYKELKGYKGVLRAVVFDATESKMIIAGKDSLIQVCSFSEQKIVVEKNIKTNAGIRSLVVKNEDEIIAAQENGTVVLYDIKNTEQKKLYSSTTSKPLCLLFNKEKNQLFVGFSDGALRLFTFLSAYAPTFIEFRAHTTAIELMTFNRDNSLLATAAADKTIKFYNTNALFENFNSNFNAAELKNHNSKAKSLLFTFDNKIVAGCTDKSVRFWETSSEKLEKKICESLKSAISEPDWKAIVGDDIPYEKTCKSKN
jgi:WD40 repeat protein